MLIDESVVLFTRFIYQNGPLFLLTFDPAVFAAWERVTLAGRVTFDLLNTDGFSCGFDFYPEVEDLCEEFSVRWV